ncbi:MAG: pentapeptide repeat-containing protein [Nanoarchaeota archaeon]|nr:pentapeptide repeat-containing protein [Nanoarchaeota archaeon]MBU1704145.1 pentapeptide repeat-containing protein [Nanoarchaeota archaeon]
MMINSLNQLLDKLRQGDLARIELLVKDKDRLNRIIVSNKEEINNATKRLRLEGQDLSNVNFSATDLTGSNFSGLNLTNSNFSYVNIVTADFSSTNLDGAGFYKAKVSQTNMMGSYNASLAGAYMTGSVNLYNVQPSGGSADTNPYNTMMPKPMMLDDTGDLSRVLINKRNW